MAFVVRVVELSHYAEPGAEQLVEGFKCAHQARLYARRRTRASVEELRGKHVAAELRRHWLVFGEDCSVVGDAYRGSLELDEFIAHPASATEIDWMALKPASGRRNPVSLSWDWPDAKDPQQRLRLELREQSMTWQEAFVRTEQTVADFSAWGLPLWMRPPPDWVIDELCVALGLTARPWTRPWTEHERDWHEAAVEGQLPRLQQLLELDPAGVNRRSPQGLTPWMRDLAGYGEQGARWLAGHGADLRQLMRNGDTVLILAGQRHLLWLVEAALAAGVAVDQPCRSGLTALAYAVLNFQQAQALTHAPVIQRLLEAGADPEFRLVALDVTLREWALQQSRPALCAALGAVPAPEVPAAPSDSGPERCYALLQLHDRLITATGAGGDGQWQAWAELPAAWRDAPGRHLEHWLQAAMQLAYAEMNAKLARSEDGGQYRLRKLRAHLLSLAEARAQPWQAAGKTLYLIRDTTGAPQVAEGDKHRDPGCMTGV